MSRQELAERYESRHRQYCGSATPPVRVELCADASAVANYATQVGLLTATSLLGRLFGDLHILVPDAPLHPALHPTATRLGEALEAERTRARPAELRGADPRTANPRTLRVRWGPGPADVAFAGGQWWAHVGDSVTAGSEPFDENPFGAAMAAVLACTEAFRMALDPACSVRTLFVSTWDWSDDPTQGPPWQLGLDLGEIWTVGVGSVGTAALHFLTLASQRFRAGLFDRDPIELHNVSRSPIFSADDEASSKVEVVARYLSARNVEVLFAQPTWLHESPEWQDRPLGRPDLLISTANEHHVRWHIESQYPPLQMHASTGKNWQCTVFRHVPIVEACSMCQFPDDGVSAPMACATGAVGRTTTGVQVDAALPFLSFGAGLMIAIEAWKLALSPTRISLVNRVFWQAASDQTFLALPLSRRSGCPCTHRSDAVHRQAIAGSRYAPLSGSHQ
ncbi:MAG: ThiF family adenylyltransferase [Acidobacteria bacterium]|nr:ThiF family adenylyltransferase [Acidobacteriota bacterium]